MRRIQRLYHLLDECNLASIERDGLLSTSRLLARIRISAPERVRLERHQRLSRTVLADGVVIRDQSPMPPAALSRCLAGGMRAADWYALVNTMVFFWLDPERLMRQARACAPWPQLMLEVDAERLLARYAGRALVTPFNVGNARRRPAIRGRGSFVPYAAWTVSGWACEGAALGREPRPASHRPVELVVPGAVVDIMDYVTQIRRVDVSGRRD